MDRGEALYDTRERTVTRHKFKIGQLVNYLGRDRAYAFIRSLSYCRQKVTYKPGQSGNPYDRCRGAPNRGAAVTMRTS
jgi:hypothetical protein